MSTEVQRFGQVEFDAAHGRLAVAGRPVDLDRNALAILAVLVREAGMEVDKDRLLEAGWPGRLVHENSLAKAISRLRHALGEDGQALETVHRYGYRLAADVESDTAARPEFTPRRRRVRRPAFLFAAAALIGLAVWGLMAFVGGAQSDGPRRVVNSEPTPMIGRVLWVDDHPENNAEEERFLEEHRIAVYRVASTEDALTLLPMYEYGAVISDMGRGDRPLAGIDLVKAMRARGDRRPFILYTVFSSDVQRKLVADSGGQGVAETRDELYAAILPLFDAKRRPRTREPVS
jgi:DNA-binding response OmpR family regulator